MSPRWVTVPSLVLASSGPPTGSGEQEGGFSTMLLAVVCKRGCWWELPVAHLQRQEEQIHHDEGKCLKPLARAAREPGGQNLLSLPQPPKSSVVSNPTSISPMHGCVIGLLHAHPEVFSSFSIPRCIPVAEESSTVVPGDGERAGKPEPSILQTIPMLGIGEQETNCSETS